jgi:CBS domain-containing protein
MVGLRQFLVRDVATTTEAARIPDAARTMVQRGVGSLVVVRDGAVVGILTDGDLVRLIARGESPETKTVGDVMSSPAITGEATESPQVLIGRLVHHRIKHMPVVEEGRLAGIVTMSAFARASAEFFDALDRELKKAGPDAEKKFGHYRAPPEPPAGMYA